MGEFLGRKRFAIALLRGEFGHLPEMVGGGLRAGGIARLGAEFFHGVAHIRRAERPGQIVEPLGGLGRAGVLLRLRLRGQFALDLPGLLRRLLGAFPGGFVAVLAGRVAGAVGGVVQGVLRVGQLQFGLFFAHAVHAVHRRLQFPRRLRRRFARRRGVAAVDPAQGFARQIVRVFEVPGDLRR